MLIDLPARPLSVGVVLSVDVFAMFSSAITVLPTMLASPLGAAGAVAVRLLCCHMPVARREDAAPSTQERHTLTIPAAAVCESSIVITRTIAPLLPSAVADQQTT
jgi:cytochrome c biogenesis factor